jgi:hypothetical protein
LPLWTGVRPREDEGRGRLRSNQNHVLSTPPMDIPCWLSRLRRTHPPSPYPGQPLSRGGIEPPALAWDGRAVPSVNTEVTRGNPCRPLGALQVGDIRNEGD